MLFSLSRAPSRADSLLYVCHCEHDVAFCRLQGDCNAPQARNDGRCGLSLRAPRGDLLEPAGVVAEQGQHRLDVECRRSILSVPRMVADIVHRLC